MWGGGRRKDYLGTVHEYDERHTINYLSFHHDRVSTYRHHLTTAFRRSMFVTLFQTLGLRQLFSGGFHGRCELSTLPAEAAPSRNHVAPQKHVNHKHHRYTHKRPLIMPHYLDFSIPNSLAMLKTHLNVLNHTFHLVRSHGFAHEPPYHPHVKRRPDM
jgi:hypothetical protein